jgi:deoxycytidylate deaminase
MSDEVAALARELPDAELVFAFVSPLGTPSSAVEAALSRALREHDYAIEVLVRLSHLLDEMQGTPRGERPEHRQERLMGAGNDLRRKHGGDYLALMAIAAINASRSIDTRQSVVPHRRRAHVIRSLKHPDEVARLRHVYGKGFFLIGVSAPRRIRRETLKNRNFPHDDANRLLDKDAAEEETFGQQTRATFELADAYLRVDGESDTRQVQAKVRRIVDILLSCPFHPPTQEEHAMFMAYAAALRSSDLSRQVGAVVANRSGDVVASGANDAPTPSGGPSSPARIEFTDDVRDMEGPDYLRGYDSNERERNKILAKVLAALVADAGPIPDEPGDRAALVKRYKDRLEGTGILDLTEFGRAVHAEMAALMSCARSGVSPVGGTLYCTTFPCHNCAKHIVAAGISTVVYVEPYPKSKAKDLHSDSISLPDEDEDEPGGRVQFRAFEGVGPRRFVDLFSLTLGSGRPVRRKQKDADGARITWKRGEGSLPRLPLDPRSYLEREDDAANFFRQKQDESAKLPTDGAPNSAAEDPDPQGSA